MSQENEQHDEMRPEYDIRGGVRGKYFARYLASRIRVRESPLVRAETTTSTGHHADESTIRVGAPPLHQGPRIEVGIPVAR